MTTNGTSGNIPATKGYSSNGAAAIELNLHITDPELCKELAGHPEGQERDNFAIGAMRIGVLALRQAQGRVDTDNVRQEGEHLISEMGHAFQKHLSDVSVQIGGELKEYLEPGKGHLNQQLQRLTGENGGSGKLSEIIRSEFEAGNSRLTTAIDGYVGQESPLGKALNPKSTEGLISQLKQSSDAVLTRQQEWIRNELSTTNPDGILNTLVAALRTSNGQMTESVEKIVKDSVTKLNEGFENQKKAYTDSQGDVLQKLTEIATRRQESEKSTRHGLEFEAAVFNFVNEQHQKAGDIVTPTGNTTGLIRSNRKGDVVIELGPEAAAAGAKIVIEAKEDASYNLPKAREELEEARKNRGANIGVFVFSKRTAYAGLEAFNRYGNDIIVVWDAEDLASDVFLSAGLSVAKALSTRANTQAKETGADFEAIEKAILEIEKQSGGLDEITRLTTTIKNNSENILNRARIMGDGLTKQIALLNEKVAALHEAVSSKT